VSTKVITPKARLSYPRLDEAQAPRVAGQKPKYSAMLLFAPGADLSPLKAAALEAGNEKWPGKAAQMFKEGSLRSPFRSGMPSKGHEEGSTFINVRSVQKPGAVLASAGADGKPVRVAPEDVKEVFYPGCWVRASLAAFAYDTDGNKGVSFALNNIQKLADGDRLDNRVAAEDEFDVDLSQAPADLSDVL
jgi:Enterobacter phage Enc34, ssDNA-binding protein